jgi:hypothetical protein
MNVDHIGGDDPELALALSDALLPADDLTEADRVFYRFSTDQGTVGLWRSGALWPRGASSIRRRPYGVSRHGFRHGRGRVAPR